MKVLYIILFVLLLVFNNAKNSKSNSKLNILLILADDLGYGDTSVEPFTGYSIYTPNLEKMAKDGAILTNFHVAAPTCTPSRAAILTGMYPWRLGIKAVFEYGGKASNRNDWLAQVPTLPMILRDHDYYTMHSGKWHLGGMRNDDLWMRQLSMDGKRGKRRCPHPGPNQQGFDDYVSLLDGPGSPRQNHLQIDETLYSRGCHALLENDVPINSLYNMAPPRAQTKPKSKAVVSISTNGSAPSQVADFGGGMDTKSDRYVDNGFIKPPKLSSAAQNGQRAKKPIVKLPMHKGIGHRASDRSSRVAARSAKGNNRVKQSRSLLAKKSGSHVTIGTKKAVQVSVASANANAAARYIKDSGISRAGGGGGGGLSFAEAAVIATTDYSGGTSSIGGSSSRSGGKAAKDDSTFPHPRKQVLKSNHQHNMTSGYLTRCEAQFAIHAIERSIEKQQPFYIQVWFHAPHAPYEEIPGYRGMYNAITRPNSRTKGLLSCDLNVTAYAREARYCYKAVGRRRVVVDRGISPLLKYRSMVSDMDFHIGRLLQTIDTLGIANNTLVVFLSDNGPENMMGSASRYRGRKRDLYEGGIRVPAIFQWKGKIPPGSVSNELAIATDLLPTLLDAADVRVPKNAKLDGMSILPLLLSARSEHKTAESKAPINSTTDSQSISQSQPFPIETEQQVFSNYSNRSILENKYRDRVAIWHTEFEGPRRTAAVIFGYKILLDSNDLPFEMYDLYTDPFEKRNIIQPFAEKTLYEYSSYMKKVKKEHQSKLKQTSYFSKMLIGTTSNEHTLVSAEKSCDYIDFDDWKFEIVNHAMRATGAAFSHANDPNLRHNNKRRNNNPKESVITLQTIMTDRRNSNIHAFIVRSIYRFMHGFAVCGNEAHQHYLLLNPGRYYKPTILSDNRPLRVNIYDKVTPWEVEKEKREFLRTGSCGTTPCKCDVPFASRISSLPFDSVTEGRRQKSAMPKSFVNASKLLSI